MGKNHVELIIRLSCYNMHWMVMSVLTIYTTGILLIGALVATLIGSIQRKPIISWWGNMLCWKTKLKFLTLVLHNNRFCHYLEILTIYKFLIKLHIIDWLCHTVGWAISLVILRWWVGVPLVAKSWPNFLRTELSYKRFLPLATFFTPPSQLKWVPGSRWAYTMGGSTLSTYNPQLLGRYASEWGLRKSMYEEWHRPAGAIMCKTLLACITSIRCITCKGAI